MQETRVQQWTTKILMLALVLIPFAGTLFAMRLLWQRAVSWNDLFLMVGMYIPVSLGITVGYHRYLTHRGFRTSLPIKILLLVLGSMALEGPALGFAANHRKHHALSDQEGDPHSPVDGFFHAHIGWIFGGQRADVNVYARDLKDDRILVWISNLFPLWVVVSGAIPFAIGGWHGLIWGGFVRIFLAH